MLKRYMQILFTEDGGAGGGGTGGNGGAGASDKKTYSESEFKDVQTRADSEKEKAKNLEVELDKAKAEAEKLKREKAEAGLADKELAETRGKEIDELKTTINTLTEDKTNIESKFNDLDKTVKKTYLDQLSDEHKKIAKLIPTVEGLAEYVKLNTTTPPAGQDAGKTGGTGNKDYTNAKWESLNHDEKEDLRAKQPEVWKKLYFDKFGNYPPA